MATRYTQEFKTEALRMSEREGVAAAVLMFEKRRQDSGSEQL